MKQPRTLRSRRDFQRVLSSGRRSRSTAGTVVVLADPASTSPPRLGLAVSTSIGGSVVRNRIKRRLRAAFHAAAVPPGTDVVVRAAPPAAVAPFQELEETIHRAVTR